MFCFSLPKEVQTVGTSSERAVIAIQAMTEARQPSSFVFLKWPACTSSCSPRSSLVFCFLGYNAQGAGGCSLGACGCRIAFVGFQNTLV